MPASTTGDRSRPPLLSRLGVWRVTRHPIVRRWYDRLSARGVFLAQLDRFERAAGAGGRETGTELPEGITVTVTRASDSLPTRLREAPVAPGDRVIFARRAGDPVGHCCVSERPVYVPELDRRLAPPGAYVWRVFVDPTERGQGIGTALVARSVSLARRTVDAATVSALVAPDNVPSRRAFRRLGFQPTVRYTSAGFGGRRWHRDRRLPSGT